MGFHHEHLDILEMRSVSWPRSPNCSECLTMFSKYDLSYHHFWRKYYVYRTYCC